MKILKPATLAIFAGIHPWTVRRLMKNPKSMKAKTKEKIRQGFSLFKATVINELETYERKINAL